MFNRVRPIPSNKARKAPLTRAETPVALTPPQAANIPPEIIEFQEYSFC